ncbi:MAG: PAS domain S-box protein [Dehalococcoidales bacterium]|nr:PAS domain S-box protein [Dehalococcoidales bacterium]
MVGRLTDIISRPGFWFILILLVLITLAHYEETLKHPAILTQLTASLGLDRHAFERILYLAPIVWGGFLFGQRGAIIISLAALACMLPRIIFISPYPIDAIYETSAVFILGNVLAISLSALRREKEQRTQLEMSQKELRASEEKYRGLFESAHDAIWLHDSEGNIIAANKAAEKLTGYSKEKLTAMNIKSLLSDKNFKIAHQVQSRLLKNESVEQPYEQSLTRKDGSEAFVQLATSLIFSSGKPAAIQHIARDVTEQKRLQENLQFYLQQVTKAQEEERKRISHELHDESIQSLVITGRQLDALASDDKGMPEDSRLRLEELRQQINNIIQELRRITQDLRPATLDRLGLLSALKWLATDACKYSGIETKVSIIGKERRVSEDIELVLFRITQEALRNVWRHSKATKAEIIVEFKPTRIRITISDNGQGFRVPQRIGDFARYGKLGLPGMQERARLIGGSVSVQSELGKGSTITIEAA